MQQTIEITWLDYPPTNNCLYTNVYMKGRVISPRYRAWMANYPPVGKVPVEPIKTDFKLYYYLAKHTDKRKRDLANYEKALTDSLVKHGYLLDDSLLIELRIKWATDMQHSGYKVRAFIEYFDGGQQ